MEFKQSVSGAFPIVGRAHRFSALFVFLALFLVFAGCGGGQTVEPVTTTTPTAVVGDASQLPDSQATESTNSTAATPPGDESAAAGPVGQLINDAALAEDVHGNLLAVHEARPWPDAYEALGGLGNLPLAGELDDAYRSATSLAAIDLSVCARTLGDVDVAESTGTFTVGNDQAVPMPTAANGSLSSSDSSLVPGFVWPAVGTCARGWMAVATTADLTSDVFVQYWPDGDDSGSRVLVWNPPLGTTDPATPAEAFGAGQTVTFNGGALTGASLVIDGWAEFVGTDPTIGGTRVVGVLVQACPSADGTWPDVGLSVDGWNLAEANPRTIDGVDALLQAEQACDNGWLTFDVPEGGKVTGAFVAERPGTPGAHWSLLGAALPDPS